MWESAGTISFDVRILAPLRRTADNFNWDSRRITEAVNASAHSSLIFKVQRKEKVTIQFCFFTDYAGLPIQASLGTRPDCVLGGKLLGGNSKTIVPKFWKFSCDSQNGVFVVLLASIFLNTWTWLGGSKGKVVVLLQRRSCSFFQIVRCYFFFLLLAKQIFHEEGLWGHRHCFHL